MAHIMAHIMAEGSLASSLCDGGPNGYFTGDPDASPEPLVFETYSQASSVSTGLIIRTARKGSR